MVIATDWIGNCKSNYHMIMTTMTNITHRNDITEIMLKVVSNNITQPPSVGVTFVCDKPSKHFYPTSLSCSHYIFTYDHDHDGPSPTVEIGFAKTIQIT
jgi:hypothetical protein